MFSMFCKPFLNFLNDRICKRKKKNEKRDNGAEERKGEFWRCNMSCRKGDRSRINKNIKMTKPVPDGPSKMLGRSCRDSLS